MRLSARIHLSICLIVFALLELWEGELAHSHRHQLKRLWTTVSTFYIAMLKIKSWGDSRWWLKFGSTEVFGLMARCETSARHQHCNVSKQCWSADDAKPAKGTAVARSGSTGVTNMSKPFVVHGFADISVCCDVDIGGLKRDFLK